MAEFSHLDEAGRARMVDVSAKSATLRQARAAARMLLKPETVAQLKAHALPKGNAVETARIAGILAAKRTADLIPLCHPIPIDWVDVRIDLAADGAEVSAEVLSRAATGVEMEALVAAAVAALTLYDMVKSVDPEARIADLRVVEKSGGKSGVSGKQGSGFRVQGSDQTPDPKPQTPKRTPVVGRVVSVNLSRRKRVAKRPVAEAELRPDMGVVGDAHSGPGDRQVSLLAVESIERQRRMFEKRRSAEKGSDPLTSGGLTPFPRCVKGYEAIRDLGPGSFAENLTVEGIPLADVAIGTRLSVGADVVLEISKIGKECHTGCAIFKLLGDCVMPREGIFGRVIAGGTVRPNDRVEVL